MQKNNLERWEPENPEFWEKEAKPIAWRNLVISIPALLQSFSIWTMWSVIIVSMKQLGFNLGMPHETSDQWTAINTLLWTLPAIAGLSGATLRIPHSFLIAIGGGRNVIFLSTLLLLLPAIGVGMALRQLDTSYAHFVILAVLSGFGGGNFASSMSNITSFFPKRLQGTALGLNAGLGNLGVSVMQFLVPAVIATGLFAGLTGGGMFPPGLEGVLGKEIFIQNAGWVLVPTLVLSTIAAFFGMNSLKTVTPELGHSGALFFKIILLMFFGLVAAGLGAYLLAIVKLSIWLVLPITILVALSLMKFLSPSQIKGNLDRQFAILKNKHNWIMTILYVMTFGSFIGYSFSFPKLIQDVFSKLPNGELNPHAPNATAWAFLGPLVGALIRPIGGWLSDKVKSGSRVTTWSTMVQILAALGVAWCMVQAKAAASPEVYWWPFFGLFMVLFIATGVGNGSTFRSIPYIFSKEQAGPVLGWTSAVAAYGGCIIPTIFGQQIAAKQPQKALYGFVVYYAICLVLNWYYYDRKNSGIKC